MIYIDNKPVNMIPQAMHTTHSEGLNLPAEQPPECAPANSYASIRDALLRLGIKATYRAIQSDNFVTGSAGWKIPSDGSPEFNDVTVRGTIYATLGEIGGFTIGATELYGGIIKTALTVGAGSTGVIMDTDGLRGYDSVLGNTFNLPTDGSAPTFSSGVINETIYEISTNAILRTSETVGDGSASSAGVLINNTGVYICGANQAVAAANLKALIDGSVNITGVITLSATSSGIANLTDAGALAIADTADFNTQVSGAEKPANNADVTLAAVNGGLAVTGGGITLSSGGSIKGGQTAFATGTGWFLGYSGGAYKFSIGDADNYLKWSGTDFFVKANHSNLMLYETVVDVNGYGDYTDIQSAIDAGKKRIFVRAGTYNITSPIVIGGCKITIIGESSTGVIIRAGADISSLISSIYGELELKNLILNGNKATYPNYTRSGIILGGGSSISKIKITNCQIFNCLDEGIDMLDDVDEILIQDCYIGNNDGSGIELNNVEGGISTIKIFNNNIKDNALYGVRILSGGYGIEINGNNIRENTYSGIYSFSSQYGVIISNNHIYSNDDEGIILDRCLGNIVVNNSIINNNNEGVKVHGGQNNVINSNYFKANGIATANTYSSIKLLRYDASHDALRNTIVGNRFDCGQEKYGIEEDANADYNLITGNIITGGDTGQINVIGANTISANNVIT